MAPVKISVIMAVRNGMPYLPEQLRSIFAQTMPPDEIIICDDLSTDGSLACIRRFDAEYPGIIRLFLNDSPLGSTKSFEKALQLATGELLFFCDQDDIWLPERCRNMAALFPDDPAGPAAVFCNSMLTDAAGKPTGKNYWSLRGFPDLSTLPAGSLSDQLELFCRRVPCAGHEMALNAAAKQLLLPFPELPGCYDTWIGMAGAAHRFWRICPQTLTLFRQHGKNSSGAGQKLSFPAQWREARRSVQNNTFRWNAALFREILNRYPALDPAVRRMLEAREAHSLRRASMTGGLLQRLPLIWKEWKNGNYTRFGRSWKSILQDLLMPRKPETK